ncbi:MAG: esterase/lipase family protein [Myxococcota bacterium]
MAVQNPVIVVPGITASQLRDEYPVDPERVWGALPFQKKWERVALHPDDLRYERDEPARVAPDQVLGVAYGELIEELRHDLSPRRDRPTPVFPFAYDWRGRLEDAEARLEGFVDEVIGRTRLLKHYHDDAWSADPKVDLVGHSMGGLVIAGLLERLGAGSRVGRVATLASPFRGSFEAVLKITTGLANLGEETPPRSREREIARLTPALYYLLPSLVGGLDIDDGLAPSLDLPASERLFDPATWQPGVVQTIEEYIRLHGVERGGRRQQAEDLFGRLLAGAHAHRRRLESLELEGAGLQGGVDGWLCIVGVDAKTRVSLRIESRRGKPRFDLRSADRHNDWDDGPDPTQTGDGTVPYAGARSGFVPLEKIVCLSPDDFGYWEVKDRALEKVAGFHGILPNMNLARRLVAAHLKGERGRGLRGRRPPDLPAEVAWSPPVSGIEERD